MTKSLYISYFGLREPLVQTQVLPYLRELAKSGVAIFLLTFEPQRWEDAQAREELRADGIEWFASKYHKRPTVPATLFDVLAGALRAIRIVRRNDVDIIHARSHVPALMGAIAKRFTRAKLLFDIRGLLADEYVEAGNWRAGGWLYRIAKRVERFLLRTSDAFVVLTEKARAELFASEAKPFEVIPCCIDPARFASAERERMRDRIVIIYVGSLGNTYLPREMAEFFAEAKAMDARVFPLILTQSRPDIIRDPLTACGFEPSEYQIGFASAAELPSYLASSDIAISFVKPGYARIAASPTKFAEYLAAGLPVISTRGIGDLDAQIASARAGVLLDGLDRDSYRRAFEEAQALRRDDDLPRRCRALAMSEYDLHAVGAARYARLYDRLQENSERRRPRRRRDAAGPAAGDGGVPPSPRLRVLALATYPVEAAASRYRVVQFTSALAARGIDVTFAPFLDRELFDALYSPRKLVLRSPRFALRLARRLGDVLRASRADVVWIQREAMLFGPPVVERLVRALGRPIVLDLDDATYIANDSPVYGRLATVLKWPSKTDRLIRWASAVIAGSETVATYAEAAGTRATIVPTIVDLNVFTPRESDRPTPVIGWIGTHSTYAFLQPLLPLLSDLGREHDFSLRIVGSGRERIEIPHVRAETKRWQLEDEVRDFQSLDIGLYPLADDPFARGKSGFKAIQYMAAGVPFVMSPVGVGATIGVEGRTHFLARDADEWRAHLTTLLRDVELRRTMGRAAREHAEASYGLDEHAERIANVLKTAANGFA